MPKKSRVLSDKGLVAVITLFFNMQHISFPRGMESVHLKCDQTTEAELLVCFPATLFASSSGLYNQRSELDKSTADKGDYIGSAAQI